MNEGEIDAVVDLLTENPEAGDVIQGTGGCRKVRIAGRGKGKSSGYRVVTFFTGPMLPVFLITVFSKGERSDLSKAERNDLAKLTRAIWKPTRNERRNCGDDDEQEGVRQDRRGTE